MNEPSRPPHSFTVTLPRRSHWLILGGFVVGLLLFVLLWASTRNTAFYRGDGAVVPTPEVAVASLPVPSTGDRMSELPPASQVSEGEKPRLVENTPPAPAPVAPVQPSVGPGEPVRPEPVSRAVASETPPQRITELSPAPQYPTSALRARESGSVLLDVMIDAQGLPIRVDVARRSGSRALDRAAVQAVEKWRFTPATMNGQPVPGQVQIPIDFTP